MNSCSIGLKPIERPAHEAGLDRLPGLVEPILQPSRLGNARDLGDDLDAGLADLGMRDVADRLAESCCHNNGNRQT